jgi:hypothetical protein
MTGLTKNKTVGPGWLCHLGSKVEDRRAPNEPQATRRRVYGLSQKNWSKIWETNLWVALAINGQHFIVIMPCFVLHQW